MVSFITAKIGTNHITSYEDAAFWRSIFGAGSHICNIGDQFRAELINANTLRVHSGQAVLDGFRVAVNNYEDLALANGAQGMRRYDLVGFAYSKNGGTQLQSMDLVVLTGQPGTTPLEPGYVSADILDEAVLEAFKPLYRITYEGISPTKVEPLMGLTRGLDECPFPVGYIVHVDNTTNPNAQWPHTTWEQIAGGRALIGSNTSYPVSATGGSTTHALTPAQVPKHTHTVNSHTHTGPSHTHTSAAHSHTSAAHSHTLSNGFAMLWRGSTQGSTTLFGNFKTTANWSENASIGDVTIHSSTGITRNVGLNLGGSTNSTTPGATGSTTPGATGASGTQATGASAPGTGTQVGTANGTAHSIMQPWYAVAIWKRIA